MSFGMKCLAASLLAFGLATTASAEGAASVDSLDDMRIAAMQASYAVDSPKIDATETLDPMRLAWIRSVFDDGNT